MEDEDYKTKHKPPSRIRYEKNNPVFSIRMPQEWHDEFKVLAEGLDLSRREFMAVALNKLKIDYEKVRAQGQKEGYSRGHIDGDAAGYARGQQKGREEGFAEGKRVGIDQGKGEWGIWYFCSLCGGPVYVKPGYGEHKEIIDYFNNYQRAHPQCAERRFYW